MSNKNPNNKFGWLSSDFQEEELSKELPEELLPAIVTSDQEKSKPLSDQKVAIAASDQKKSKLLSDQKPAVVASDQEKSKLLSDQKPAVATSDQKKSKLLSDQNPSSDQTSINTNNPTEDKMQKNTTKNVPTKSVVTKNVPTKNIPAKNTRLANTVAPANVEEPKSFGRDGKRSNPGYKLVGVQLSVSLHRKAKEILLQQGEERNFSDLINELLEDWISNNQ